MALASTGIWEVRSTGNDLNAGFFNPALSGTDYSQQDSAQLTLADVVSDGTTSITSATGGFTSVMVGNGLSIAGTIYEIKAVSNTSTISVDRNAPSATGQAARVGGAVGSPGKVAGVVVSGNQIWLRGTFPISTTTGNVSGGVVSPIAGGTGVGSSPQGVSKWEAYATTRGDGGQATLQASGISSVTLWSFSNLAPFCRLLNVVLDGNNQTSIRGAAGGGGANWVYAVNCVAKNCKNGGLWQFSGVYGCQIQSCSGTSGIDGCNRVVNTIAYGQTGGECAIHARSGALLNCLVYNCTVPGLKTDSGGAMWDCRVFNCSYGIQAYGNIRDDAVVGCLVWACTVRNYNNGTNTTIIGCAGGGGATADVNANGVIPLTVNPYADSANADFRLTPAATSQLLAAGMNLQTAWLSSYLTRRSIVL